MNKKLILVGLLCSLALSVGTPALAEEMQIGFVDTQAILAQSSLLAELKVAEQDLVGAEKKLYDTRNKKIKELEEAQKKMKPEEFLQLRQKYEREIIEMVKSEEKRLQARKAEIEKKKKQLEADVQAVVRDIAKKKGLALVVNKQIVLYGGTDITSEVVAELKKK